ncbi:hypothetical protein MIR68_003636 [Amoeboaphelidium protococcarum]|nr:hypothetical protein MIR68_003636 [Amoeboaphelidium protococcarum]
MGNILSCQCCSSCRQDNHGLYEPLLQESEREAVSDLLQFLENRGDTVYFEGDALRALNTLSYSQNVDLQRSAALAFAEITERQVQEVDASVLDPLLHLLRSSTDVEVQRAASAALGNLAVSINNKVKIVRLGGLAPLISQMTSPHAEVQCNAVGCITNLATHEENKSAIARSGALGPLVRLTRNTRDIRVLRNACGALLNMTHSEENRRELVDCNVIPVLVHILHSYTLGKGIADDDVVYYCTTAISNLAVDASNRKRLAGEKSLVGDLIELLLPSCQLKIRCQSALALRNLASDAFFQLEIVSNQNGLARLLTLLTEQPFDSPLAAQPVISAVACIRNVSIHPLNEQTILKAGFLPSLVSILNSDSLSEESRCHAISTIRNLAAGLGSGEKTDDMDTMIKSGTIEVIKTLIERTVSDLNSNSDHLSVSWIIMSEMTACLAVLALSDLLKPFMLQCDILQTLLSLLDGSQRYLIPPEVQGNAAATIGNLATKCPDLTYFLGNEKVWNKIVSYIERFLTGVVDIDGDSMSLSSDLGQAYQHIGVWTLLQLLEVGSSQSIETFARVKSLIKSRGHLVKLLQNISAINNSSNQSEEEVVNLSLKVLALLNSQKS